MLVTEEGFLQYMNIPESNINFNRMYFLSISMINFIYNVDIEEIFADLSIPCQGKVTMAIYEQMNYLDYHISNNFDGQVTPTYVAIADFMYTMEKGANGMNTFILSPAVRHILNNCLPKKSSVVEIRGCM